MAAVFWSAILVACIAGIVLMMWWAAVSITSVTFGQLVFCALFYIAGFCHYKIWGK